VTPRRDATTDTRLDGSDAAPRFPAHFEIVTFDAQFDTARCIDIALSSRGVGALFAETPAFRLTVGGARATTQ
jgi:hypothetical protein